MATAGAIRATAAASSTAFHGYPLQAEVPVDDPRGWRVPSLMGGGCAALAVVGTIAGLAAVHLPWMLPISSGLESHLRAQRLLALFALGAGYSLAKTHSLRRAGRASFSPGGVVFRGKGLLERVVPWSQLDRYADGSPAAVELLRRGETWPRAALAIPTPDEATRTAVLRELDAHGLVRVEGSHPGRTVGRAVVAGTLVVLLALAVHFVATARYRAICALWHGTLSEAEASAALEDLVTVRHLVRPVIGTEDSLFVEEHHAWVRDISQGLDASFETGARFYSGPDVRHFKGFDPLSGYMDWLETDATTDLDVDGRPLAKESWSVDSLDDRYNPVEFYVDSRVHGLAPGRHELRFVTHLRTQFGACTKEERRTIEVVPGSIAARTVKLVAGECADLSVRVDSNRWCYVFQESGRRRSLFGRVEISEDGRLLGEAKLIFQGDRAGRALVIGPGKTFELPTLTRGRHVLTFRFTPDARVAFENDVNVTEILGSPFERALVLEVP